MACVSAVGEAEDEAERFRAELALAIYLLRQNYDLTPADYFELLSRPPDDPELSALQEALHTIAMTHLRTLLGLREVLDPSATAPAIDPTKAGSGRATGGLSLDSA